MRLTDLDPEWWNGRKVGDGIAQGISFLCPKRLAKPVRHVVLFEPIINPYRGSFGPEVDVALENLLLGVPGPRWHRDTNGDGFDGLSLFPSIDNKNRDGSSCCHVTIMGGQVVFAEP